MLRERERSFDNSIVQTCERKCDFGLKRPNPQVVGRTRIDDNPADPTNRFTKHFKRLVNVLNLRKNMRPCWHCRVSAVEFWLPAGT